MPLNQSDSKSMLRHQRLCLTQIGIYKLLLSFLTQVALALSVSDTHQFSTHNSKYLELTEQSEACSFYFRDITVSVILHCDLSAIRRSNGKRLCRRDN
ncbi:hypothetical protein TNCT_675641 [Trichonephila clavata]|uniref:Uncharacterized protein n=1 Tax=Trichonephila clavata TaxID=2740835 RepID=A0A8X6LK71_TRICU|nr:hypothetical protein TNCT_675641 [Trichonephila clavata]